MNKTVGIELTLSEQDGSVVWKTQEITNWLDTDEAISNWINLKIMKAYDSSVENDLELSVSVEIRSGKGEINE